MSRARPIEINGEKFWFDTSRNNEKATDKQIELLATVEQVDLEDLLESVVTQGEVLRRLREALGTTPVIPHDVLVRRQKWRKQRSEQPCCRMCSKVGDSTKHHFVNRWILKELDSYERLWADRKLNCIPLCIDCHRDLHERNDVPISIVPYLTDAEKEYAGRALTAFAEQRPKVFILVAKGTAYESQLLRDWLAGEFDVSAEARVAPAPSLDSVMSLAAVA